MEKSSLEEISKVLDFNFKNSLELKPLEVHCPDCNKLYIVNPHEIMVARPSFVCKSCTVKFYINYPECTYESKIIGKSVERKALSKMGFQLESDFLEKEVVAEAPKESVPIEAKVQTPKKQERAPVQENKSQQVVTPVKACPKCEYINPAAVEECLKCSVIFAKVHSKTQFNERVFASDELKDLWELALDNYEVETAHQNFIRYSHVEGNLEYASQKYNTILSVNPYDDIANKMKKQIITLSTVDFEKSSIKPVKSVFRFFNLSTLSFVLGLALILLGFMFPQFKNLMGIGAFSLCLILGLKYLQIK